MFRSLRTHRGLMLRLAQREVLNRYKGSIVGVAWSLIQPLMMLAVYTFVFSEVFQARWGLQEDSKGMFALAIFSGLIFYTLFAECALKAPGLLLANPSYITKVIFPLEILPVVSMLVSLFNALSSLLVLAVGILILRGAIPQTFLCTLLLLVPLAIFSTGMGWFLSAAGIYLRDLVLIVAPLTTILMFLVPVLYPLAQVPERWRGLVEVNPLTFIIESSRNATLVGLAPDWATLSLYTLGAILFSLLGYTIFEKARRGFADVV